MRYGDGRVRAYDFSYPRGKRYPESPLWILNWHIRDCVKEFVDSVREGYLFRLLTGLGIQKFTSGGDDFVCIWQNGKIVSIVYVEEELAAMDAFIATL